MREILADIAPSRLVLATRCRSFPLSCAGGSTELPAYFLLAGETCRPNNTTRRRHAQRRSHRLTLKHFPSPFRKERTVKRPSIYVKMKVLGAMEVVEGRTRHERIHNVAKMTFLDEEGEPHRFTWRTIQTWYYRYKNYGVTAMDNHSRADKGRPRKVTPEEVLEAINAALPHFHQKKKPHKSAIYRFCIEKGLLRADQIALTTFCRFVREYELLKEDVGDNKRRLAFSMQYANQLWQADTMFGPHVVGAHGQKRQAKLIAFIDDASRVLYHGEFFFDENADSMIKALRAAFYKRGVPEQLPVDNGSIYGCQKITLVSARVGCILRHTAVRDAAAKGKIERWYQRLLPLSLSRLRRTSSDGESPQQSGALLLLRPQLEQH